MATRTRRKPLRLPRWNWLDNVGFAQYSDGRLVFEIDLPVELIVNAVELAQSEGGPLETKDPKVSLYERLTTRDGIVDVGVTTALPSGKQSFAIEIPADTVLELVRAEAEDKGGVLRKYRRRLERPKKTKRRSKSKAK